MSVRIEQENQEYLRLGVAGELWGNFLNDCDRVIGKKECRGHF